MNLDVRLQFIQCTPSFMIQQLEALLLIDTPNVFNTQVNRKVALKNIQHLCPSLATVFINTYRDCPSLFIDSESIPSHEGTTQGDPLVMAMYAIGVVQDMLIQHKSQVWVLC